MTHSHLDNIAAAAVANNTRRSSKPGMSSDSFQANKLLKSFHSKEQISDQQSQQLDISNYHKGIEKKQQEVYQRLQNQKIQKDR